MRAIFNPNPILVPKKKYLEMLNDIIVVEGTEENVLDTINIMILPLYYKSLIEPEIELLSDEAKECVVIEDDGKKAFNGVWMWVNDGNSELPYWWKQFVTYLDPDKVDLYIKHGHISKEWLEEHYKETHTSYIEKLDLTYEFTNEDLWRHESIQNLFAPVVTTFNTLSYYLLSCSEDLYTKEWNNKYVNQLKEAYTYPDEIASYYIQEEVGHVPNILRILGATCAKHIVINVSYSYNNYNLYSDYNSRDLEPVIINCEVTRVEDSEGNTNYKLHFTTKELKPNTYILGYPKTSSQSNEDIDNYITVTNNSTYSLKVNND
jgi:hypothetical protein